MAAVIFRDATAADIKQFVSDPWPHRIRAFAAEVDGKLLGVGGRVVLPDGTWAAFLHVKPEARRFKVALHKAGLRTLQDARASGIRTLVALAEPGIEPAARWLERLGFKSVKVGTDMAWVWTDKA